MKALKEKRISLRSLLRRSLVILSLLALAFAFAGCSSDDGGSEDIVQPPVTPPPEPVKEAISLKVINQPLTISYIGLPPDLTGMIVEVRFRQGTNEFTEMISDPSEFFTDPFILREITGVVWETTEGDGPNNTGAATDRPQAIPIYHVSNKTASTPVILQAVRMYSDLRYTGTLVKRDYFEDDLVDFAGITVELDYDAADYRDNVDPDAGMNMAIAKEWGATSKKVPLSEAYLSENFGGNSGITGVDGEEKVVYITIPGTATPLEFPFDNFYTVRAIELESIGAMGDYFQYDMVGLTNAEKQNYWFKEFEKANLQLKVHYGGTLQTKIIGMKEVYRASQLTLNSNVGGGPAASLVAPDLSLDDIDLIIARLAYYGNERFPNQVINLPISVWEFNDEIAFNLKENIKPEVLPLQVKAQNASGLVPPLSLSSTAMQGYTVQAVAATYDLDLVYTKPGATAYKHINQFLVNPITFAAVNTGWWTVNFENTGEEFEEYEATFTIDATNLSTLFNITYTDDLDADMTFQILPP